MFGARRSIARLFLLTACDRPWTALSAPDNANFPPQHGHGQHRVCLQRAPSGRGRPGPEGSWRRGPSPRRRPTPGEEKKPDTRGMTQHDAEEDAAQAAARAGAVVGAVDSVADLRRVADLFSRVWAAPQA